MLVSFVVFWTTPIPLSHSALFLLSVWVVKIEEHPTAFDPSPWVNYQGEMYMGQEGVRYPMVTKPDRVDKWG